MFPVIHGILAQTQEGKSVCKYPLDKTDWSDFPLPVIAAEPLDNSYQKFRVAGGMSADSIQVAAPDGFELDLDTGRFIVPNRGVLSESVIYAIKVKYSGSPRTIQLGVPQLHLYSPEVDIWVEINSFTIEALEGKWGIRVGLPNPTAYELPNEFTIIVFSGEEVELDIPFYSYIPELGVCDYSGFVPGAESFEGVEYGFTLVASSQIEDYTVELITDKAALENLIGDFDITAATGITKLETICGQVIEFQAHGCTYPLNMTDFSQIEQNLEVPPGIIGAFTPLDSSYQKFKLDSLEETSFILYGLKDGTSIDSEGIVNFPDKSFNANNPSYALKYKITNAEVIQEDDDALEIGADFYAGSNVASYILNFISDGLGGFGKFPWHYHGDRPSDTAAVPLEGIITFVIYRAYVAYVLDGEIVGWGYSNNFSVFDDISKIDNWGLSLSAMNLGQSLELELITDHETLSNLLSGVEFPDDMPADFKPATLCGQPLDLTPSSGG